MSIVNQLFHFHHKRALSTLVSAIRFSRQYRAKPLLANRNQEYGKRYLSSQKDPLESQSDEQLVVRAESGVPTGQEETSDWFENRYQDTSCHAKDGLDPNEWLLLYRISDEKMRNRLEYSLYAVALGAIACGTFIFVITCIRRDENPFAVAPAFALGGVMAIYYATRMRRYGVLRMYARRNEQEQWERWRYTQLMLPPSKRNIFAPTRYYKIVWSDMMHRPRTFDYNSLQVSDWVHRPRWFTRALYGNFLVKGRPWAVHPEFFDEAPDYIFVRRK